MSRPGSKPGDMYNYEAVAYIEANPEVIPLLSKDDILVGNIIPEPFSREQSYLGVEILFDAILDGADREFFCECKSQVEPQPLHMNSLGVKDSILQYLAAEKYRYSNVRREGIYYLLVSNRPMVSLQSEIGELRVADDTALAEYMKTIQLHALKKWASLRELPKMEIRWLRNTLQRTILVQVDRGAIEDARKNDPRFRLAFDRLLAQVRKRDPTRLPLQYRNEKTIRLILASEGDILPTAIDGYLAEIDNRIVEEVVSHAKTSQTNLRAVALSKLSFREPIDLVHDSGISAEIAMTNVIRALNNHLQSLGLNTLVIITPGSYCFYFFNPDWMHSIIRDPKNTTSTGYHKMSAILKAIGGEVPEFVLMMLVSETMRLKASTDVRFDVMDFSGMEEAYS